MTREHGEMYMSVSENIPLHGFILSVSDIDIQTGDETPIDNLYPLFATCKASEADKLFCIGIARRESAQGNDTLLMVSPEAHVKI